MLYPGENNIIMPCLSRTERLVTSKGNQFATIEDSICQVVKTQGGLKPISDSLKSEAQIIAGIATELFGEDSRLDWQAMEQIMISTKATILLRLLTALRTLMSVSVKASAVFIYTILPVIVSGILIVVKHNLKCRSIPSLMWRKRCILSRML